MTDSALRPSKMRAERLISLFSSLIFSVIFAEVEFRATIFLFLLFFSSPFFLFLFLLSCLEQWQKNFFLIPYKFVILAICTFFFSDCYRDYNMPH